MESYTAMAAVALCKRKVTSSAHSAASLADSQMIIIAPGFSPMRVISRMSMLFCRENSKIARGPRNRIPRLQMDREENIMNIREIR